MEALLGLCGKDFTLIAADTNAARSIVVMKRGEDKTRDLNRHTVMSFAGEAGDAVNFAEYIQRNISLYEIRNGIALSPSGLAHFVRRELADSLRSRNPYQVNLLLGGVDPKTSEPALFWMDYLGAMVKVPFGAHGYSAYFCSSVFDRHWKPDMNLDEAKDVLKKCIHELRTRLVINQGEFLVKMIDKDGIHVLEAM
ncbi:nucleophile aminohydrolase [Hyaloraphidium curvatum]|nr:nucleophile aminohydrolase [Hyaloraphidium curvatum]